MREAEALENAIDPWLQHMRWRGDFVRWRERRLNQEQYQGERVAMLAGAAGQLAGLRLLDLGAGMGGFAVAAALGGAQVTACEYNPAYCRIIELRAARHGLRLPVFNAAGEHLPFPDAAFDAVTAWDVLEHVQDPQRVLERWVQSFAVGVPTLISAHFTPAANKGDPAYFAPKDVQHTPVNELPVTAEAKSRCFLRAAALLRRLRSVVQQPGEYFQVLILGGQVHIGRLVDKQMPAATRDAFVSERDLADMAEAVKQAE